jgi:hypothetical protein
MALAAFAQQPAQRPNFSQFPAGKMFHGTPVPPRLVTKDQRMFRTMIRTGGENHATFAGHYTIAEWGCGTDCSQFAVMDLMTGAVSGPFTVSGLPWSWFEDHKVGHLEHIDFKSTSRLLKVSGCPDEHDCGFYDYVVEDGKALKLIRKELLSKQYQPEP